MLGSGKPAAANHNVQRHGFSPGPRITTTTDTKVDIQLTIVFKLTSQSGTLNVLE